MADNPAESNIWRFIRRISVVVSIPTSLITIGKLLSLSEYFDLRGVEWTWALGAGFCFAAPGLAYVVLARVAKERKVKARKGDETLGKVPRYDRWKRTCAGGTLLLLLVGGASLMIANSGRPKKPLILVSRFDGPNPQNYRVASTIVSRLRSSPLENEYEVRVLSKRLKSSTSRENALEIAEDEHADVFVWGWYGIEDSSIVSLNLAAMGQFARFESKDPTQEMSLSLGPLFGGGPAIGPKSHLGSYSLQSDFSAAVERVVLQLLALSSFESSEWELALRCLSQAERALTSSDKLGRALIYNLRSQVLLYGLQKNKEALEYNGMVLTNLLGFAASDVEKQDRMKDTTYYTKKTSSLNDFRLLSKSSGEGTFSSAKYLLSQVFLTRARIYQGLDSTEFPFDTARIAFNDLTIAIAWYPTFAAYHERAKMHLHRGAVDSAIVDLEHAIAIDSSKAGAHIDMASAQVRNKDYERAIESAERAVRLAPSSPYPYYYKGRALRKMGSLRQNPELYRKALTSLQKAIRRDYSYGLAHDEMGETYELLGRRAEAIEAFGEAIDLMPRNADVWYDRGINHFAQGSYPKALSDFGEALSIDSSHYESRLYRGALRGYMGYTELALEDLGRASIVDTINADLYIHYSDTYFQADSMRAARSFLERAVKLSPFDDVTRASTSLRRSKIERRSDTPLR